MSHKQISIFKISFYAALLFFNKSLYAQVKWVNVDIDYTPLPKGFHIYKTTDSLDGKPFAAYYAVADLKNKKLKFTTDTTYKRRLTPTQFYKKNWQPLLVVNATYFSFVTHQNLNLVIKDGKLLGLNIHSISLKGKDTFMYKHPFASAIGISKRRKPDIAWTYTDSTSKKPYALQFVRYPVKDSLSTFLFKKTLLCRTEIVEGNNVVNKGNKHRLKKWKMQTAVGGGPVLVQNGKINITNDEEMKFTGNSIADKHPRTLMGYSNNGELIIMVIEGRYPGKAEGASLLQAAGLMVKLGCKEALNLDGGGSSCMLVNGKETIKPSDKGIQRALPAVFIINQKLK